MSKLARALALVAMLAAMNLAGMTAVAHAYPLDPAGQRHRALGQLEFPAAADHAVASGEQSTGDATARRLLARERSSVPNLVPSKAQVAGPVRPDEPSGQPGWLTPALSVLAAVLALAATTVAMMAARRAQRAHRAGQTA
jgi:hypothetical protein